MRTELEIIEALNSITGSDELECKTATIEENAPLALIQLELETKVKVLKWVLNQ